MPNYFTHLQFGGRVLAALPEPLRTRIEAQRADFDVGCYGPDPLFFYHLHHDNPVRQVGLRMHKVSALPVFRRLARIISEDRPGGAGYAAGFLCHFALDAGCHGYIEDRAAGGQTSHLRMEGEYDRVLMERAGIDPLRQTPMPRHRLNPQETETIALIYLGVTARQFRESMGSYRRVCRLQTLACRVGLSGAVDALSLRTPDKPDFRGAVLSRRAAGECAVSSTVLDGLVDRAVPIAAEKICVLFRTAAGEAVLDSWFDRDFSGNRCGKPVENVEN